MIEKKAKENQIISAENTNSKLSDTGCQKSYKPLESVDTKKELSKIAGVSHDTYNKGRKILESDDEELKKKVMNGEIKINTDYKITANKTLTEKKVRASFIKVCNCTTLYVFKSKNLLDVNLFSILSPNMVELY